MLRRGQALTIENQQISARQAAPLLAKLAETFEVVLTHGNGPQVGQLALERSATFDMLGAESQGQIGHILASALEGAGIRTAAVLSQVLVSEEDPAFNDPTKFVGGIMTEAEAKSKAQTLGWEVKADGRGGAYRRVVPSPKPLEIRQLDAVKALLDAKFPMVIACGGGGIPVKKSADGALVGIEAVIDKDLCGALLARSVGADGLVILTDGGGIWENFGRPNAREMRRATPQYLKDSKAGAGFPGSMGPKVQACLDFLDKSPNPRAWACIADLNDAAGILTGEAGTVIAKYGFAPAAEAEGVEWRTTTHTHNDNPVSAK